MRRFDDPYINCPIDPQHRMPSLRLQWHIQNCKRTYLEKNPGKMVYHCKHYYLHIYLDEEKLKLHEIQECLKNPDVVKKQKLDQLAQELLELGDSDDEEVKEV
jgi:hypothetical protein